MTIEESRTGESMLQRQIGRMEPSIGETQKIRIKLLIKHKTLQVYSKVGSLCLRGMSILEYISSGVFIKDPQAIHTISIQRIQSYSTCWVNFVCPKLENPLNTCLTLTLHSNWAEDILKPKNALPKHQTNSTPPETTYKPLFQTPLLTSELVSELDSFLMLGGFDLRRFTTYTLNPAADLLVQENCEKACNSSNELTTQGTCQTNHQCGECFHFILDLTRLFNAITLLSAEDVGNDLGMNVFLYFAHVCSYFSLFEHCISSSSRDIRTRRVYCKRSAGNGRYLGEATACFWCREPAVCGAQSQTIMYKGRIWGQKLGMLDLLFTWLSYNLPGLSSLIAHARHLVLPPVYGKVSGKALVPGVVVTGQEGRVALAVHHSVLPLLSTAESGAPGPGASLRVTRSCEVVASVTLRVSTAPLPKNTTQKECTRLGRRVGCIVLVWVWLSQHYGVAHVGAFWPIAHWYGGHHLRWIEGQHHWNIGTCTSLDHIGMEQTRPSRWNLEQMVFE
ncbi:hypothetical protein PM082_023354 [Marasmius tenuissimus]|nr:hypothetical protein PM082_023354 [Marasmius tenuissimus]